MSCHLKVQEGVLMLLGKLKKQGKPSLCFPFRRQLSHRESEIRQGYGMRGRQRDGFFSFFTPVSEVTISFNLSKTASHFRVIADNKTLVWASRQMPGKAERRFFYAETHLRFIPHVNSKARSLQALALRGPSR